MANALYALAKISLLTQNPSIDIDTDTIKATLIDTANYTVNLTTHQYMNTNTVAAAAKVGSPVTLTGKTVTLTGNNAVFRASPTIFPTITGATTEAIILWKDGGGGGTSASGTTDPLLAYLDTATGLPVTPNGGDITVTWDTGANGIFAV